MMHHLTKKLTALALFAALAFFPATKLLAGSLDSPAAPTDAGSAMYTLEDIFNRLDSGATGSKRVGPYVEPGIGPTAGTGKTLDEVMSKAPAVDVNGAGVANVLQGKTFWGLLSGGGWGMQTGTLAAQTPTNTTVEQQAGIYEAFNLSTVDTDLVAGNIKKDVVIFGVTGTLLEAGVPKTGQTTSYGPRDDGELYQGVTWPDPRFTVNLIGRLRLPDGTVTDNLTGLVWLKDADCGGTKTWANALAFANGLRHGKCGLTDGSAAGDWWLPNLRQLQSLVDYGQSNPALPSDHPFTGVQSSVYWSSTSSADGTGNAWYVSMFSGYVSANVKTGTYRVWPVRAGQ